MINEMILKYEKNKEDFSKQLLFIIDKADNISKAQLLAYFTSLLIKNEISYEEFSYFSHVINKMSFEDIKKFSDKYVNSAFLADPELLSIMFSYGFINIFNENGDILLTGMISDKFKITDKARKFRKKLQEFF